MDPEILEALKHYSPEEVAAWLVKNGRPVPPQLMPPEVADASRAPQPSGDGMATATLAGLGGAGIAGAYGGTAAARRYVSPTGRANARLIRAITQSGGQEAIERELANYDRAGRGGIVTLGDVARPLGEQGTDFVATNNEQARTNLLDIHADRQRGVPQRLLSDVEQIAPGGYSAPGYLSDVSSQSQRAFAASEHGYAGLRAANPAIDPRLNRELFVFTQSPELAELWDAANRVAQIGPMPAAGPTSFATLHDMKQSLDDAVDAAFRGGHGTLGDRLRAARNHLDGLLERAVPEYAEVNRQYAAFSRHQEALQLGLEAWNNHAIQLPDLERQLADMTAEQRAAFRQGVVGGYIRDIENVKSNRNLANEMMSRSATTERKLELIFGSQRAFEQAVQRFAQEQSMSRMGGYVGGSATARRLASGAGELSEAGAEAAMTHPTSARGFVGRMMSKVPEAIKAREAERLAPFFTTQGSDAIRALLRTIR